MNVSWWVENFSRAVKKNIRDHFEIQSASEGQFRQAGDKEDRQNAFGCMLPFRMIRYARNCRAPVGVHARARGRVVCTVRDAPRAWPSSVHESIPNYIRWPRILLWSGDWKLHDFSIRSIFDASKKKMKKVKKKYR